MTVPYVRGLDPDLLLHSPDGEHRGLFARVGDLFPLNPAGHLLLGRAERATGARPWGLRHLRAPRPRAGRHSGDATTETSEVPSLDHHGPQREEARSD